MQGAAQCVGGLRSICIIVRGQTKKKTTDTHTAAIHQRFVTVYTHTYGDSRQRANCAQPSAGYRPWQSVRLHARLSRAAVMAPLFGTHPASFGLVGSGPPSG